MSRQSPFLLLRQFPGQKNIKQYTINDGKDNGDNNNNNNINNNNHNNNKV